MKKHHTGELHTKKVQFYTRRRNTLSFDSPCTHAKIISRKSLKYAQLNSSWLGLRMSKPSSRKITQVKQTLHRRESGLVCKHQIMQIKKLRKLLNHFI